MEPIALTRAAHLMPFLKILRECGAPVDRELARLNLPAACELDADVYIPLFRGMQFVDRMERLQSIDDFGFEVARQYDVEVLGPEFRAMRSGLRSVLCRLKAFCHLAIKEDTRVRFWIEPQRGGIRVRHQIRNCPADLTVRQAEWVQNAIVVAIVRDFAGTRWSPPAMAFSEPFTPCGRIADHIPTTRVRTGRRTAWVDLPSAVLALPPRRHQTIPLDFVNGICTSLPPAAEVDLCDSLRLLLRSYLGEGVPTVQFTAEMAGVGVRTLQRRLATTGLTYSDVLEQTRYEVAADLLRDPSAKIIDVALAVGYEDPSHFARAFRRISGLSPKQFRAQATDPPGPS